MKEEIKEILNQLEIIARKHTIEVCEDGSKIEFMPASVVDELRLNNYSSKLLLDCITNLQQEKELNRLKNIIDRIDFFVDRTIEVIKQQPTGNDEWILERLNGIKYLTELKEGKK